MLSLSLLFGKQLETQNWKKRTRSRNVVKKNLSSTEKNIVFFIARCYDCEDKRQYSAKNENIEEVERIIT